MDEKLCIPIHEMNRRPKELFMYAKNHIEFMFYSVKLNKHLAIVSNTVNELCIEYTLFICNLILHNDEKYPFYALALFDFMANDNHISLSPWIACHQKSINCDKSDHFLFCLIENPEQLVCYNATQGHCYIWSLESIEAAFISQTLN